MIADATVMRVGGIAISQRLLRMAATVIGLMVGTWLLLPLVGPVHPEGFTGSVAALALHLNRDALANFDPLQALNTEYFGLTKLGWVLALAGLMKAGLGSLAAMRVLTWISFATLCGASLQLVRRWTHAPLLLIAAGLVVLPGISESAFIFNDNVPSAALAALALSSLYLPRFGVGAVACGLLFGLSVLTRTDTILVGAAVPVIMWERTRDLRTTAYALAATTITGAVVLLGTLAVFHASILDVFRVAAAAVAGWDRPVSAFRPVVMFVYFVGLPGMLLLACGLVSLFRRHDRLEMARLLLVPFLFLLLIGSKLWEARQFLPLTPFFLAIAVEGFRMVTGTKGGGGLAQRAALGALLGVSLLGPISVPLQEDGSHALGGRLANVSHWRDWQKQIDADFALLATLPAHAAAERPLAVVADQWNEDRYTHLSLEEAGYGIAPAPNAACAAVAEHFVKGPSEIYLVRPQLGYVRYWRQLLGERMERFALPCITSVHASVVLIGSTARLHKLVGAPESQPAPGVLYLPLGLQPLDASGLRRLIGGYHDDARRDRLSGRPGGTLAQAALATQRRTNFHF
jgi:hypothetical protein